MKPTRMGYAETLVKLGRINKNVVVLDADLSKSTLTYMFAAEFPDRFFDMGIAEQNMLGVAGGLSLTGKIPFVTTYGTFVAGRAWDQIRTTVCYSNLNVKIGGAHGGVSVGPDGATHQALEEITTMRVLPGMTVIAPADYIETAKATEAAANYFGPVYLRFGREAVPIITVEEDPFIIGKANQYRDGNDVTIIACGVMLAHSLWAAEELAKEGIEARVINMHTIKPIDVEAIVKAAEETGAIVTAEEHQVIGGLGGAVAEVVVKTAPVPMEIVGILDRFGESGQPEELYKEFNVTPEDVAEAVRRVMARKRGRRL
ncbi:MAG: transketolase family protein [Chloroflexi bacterium]|nr:transketolase family protein [Chloroflexota bacterium]MCL5075435.1 transketolase family protein [Chloroflexota bacterium]